MLKNISEVGWCYLTYGLLTCGYFCACCDWRLEVSGRPGIRRPSRRRQFLFRRLVVRPQFGRLLGGGK